MECNSLTCFIVLLSLYKPDILHNLHHTTPQPGNFKGSVHEKLIEV